MGVKHTTNLANSGESLILTGTDAITRVEKMLDGKELVNSTPRNMLASAIGLTMSGVRSRCNLFSDELAASRDLLQQAVEGHIPLVIHVTTRTDDTHINSLVDSGALILYAGTVQEAIDFTLIARAVAEQTLTPAVVVMEYEVSSKPQSIELPSPQLIERIVGDTTDKIKLNHPSQQIVFGPERKRLPCRYNLDHPTMQGAVADKYSSRVNKISHTIFFGAEIGASVDTVFHKFNEATGREYSKLSYPNNRSGKRVNKRVLICQGEVKERCKQISEKISSKVLVVGITVVAPHPLQELREVVQSADEIIVLERAISATNSLLPLHKQITALASHSSRIHSISYGVDGAPIYDNDLIAALEIKSSAPAQTLYLGLTPTTEINNPKQQVQHDLLERNYPELHTLGLNGGLTENSDSSNLNPEIKHTPMAVRHLGSGELSNFWNQTGVLYRDQQESRQGLSPNAGFGEIPPLTSTFNSINSKYLPKFDHDNCSGCGECWINCPDSAIGATSISPAKLLEFGLSLGGADALRPHLSKLSRAMGENGKSIKQSWEIVMQNSPLPEERRIAADKAIEQLNANLKDIPLAITEPLFIDRERFKAGAGELLTIAINPESCKGCGICAEMCGDNLALNMVESSEINREQLYQQWRVWEQMPDSSSATLTEFSKRPEIGEIKAAMLSRYAAMSIGGGDSAEPGSGEKIALRQIFATTEYVQQPQIRSLINEMEELHSKLIRGIKVQLAEASHIDNLSELAKELESQQNRQLDLKNLINSTDDGVDIHKLREWIELTEMLRSEIAEIESGENSLGRSRYSLALTEGALTNWAGSFPTNPFQVPVAIAPSSSIAALACGLIEGVLEQTTATQRILRTAKLLLKGASEAERREVKHIQWSDLSEIELQRSPPLFLIGNESTLGVNSAGDISWILNSKLPIKIVILADMQSTPNQSNLTMLALSQRNSYVAQSSVASPDHLNSSIKEALHHSGPALIRVHTPSPSMGGFSTELTITEAKSSISNLALTLFSYSPTREGIFGERIRLESVDIADGAESEEHTLLQELAGEVTPFTKKIRDEAERSVAELHKDEIDILKNAHQIEVTELRNKMEVEITQRITSQLTELVNYNQT